MPCHLFSIKCSQFLLSSSFFLHISIIVSLFYLVIIYFYWDFFLIVTTISLSDFPFLILLASVFKSIYFRCYNYWRITNWSPFKNQIYSSKIILSKFLTFQLRIIESNIHLGRSWISGQTISLCIIWYVTPSSPPLILVYI